MNSTTFMVSGKDFEQALQRNEAVQSQFIEYQRKGKISGISSIAALLPSRLQQEENLQRWDNFWSKKKKEQLREIFHHTEANCWQPMVRNVAKLRGIRFGNEIYHVCLTFTETLLPSVRIVLLYGI